MLAYFHQIACRFLEPDPGSKPASKRSSAPRASGVDQFGKLRGVKLIRASDGKLVELCEQWTQKETAVVVFARHMGCHFCAELAMQLRKDVQPKLDKLGVKLYLVAIGDLERSKYFIEFTGFPAELLLCDPDSGSYKRLSFHSGLFSTLMNPAIFLALFKRFRNGEMVNLIKMLPTWKIWTPKNVNDALIQGGVFVFQGSNCKLDMFDTSNGAYHDFDMVLDVVKHITKTADS